VTNAEEIPPPNSPKPHEQWIALHVTARGRIVQARAHLGQIKTERSAPKEDNLGFTLLRDLYAEPAEAFDWLLEDRFLVGGTGVIVGKPKSGKSTFARNLAVAVARGEPFLGWQTKQGAVVYAALEEERGQVRAHFRDLGAQGNEPIYIFARAAPNEALVWLRRAVENYRPGLTNVDPLFRGVRVKDTNDYAQVTAALEPLVTLARETGTFVLGVHHSGKFKRDAIDSALGSTAIVGAVDTIVVLAQHDKSNSSDQAAIRV
jgi:RecA-family ATPase